jgi:hypothetical protein
MYGKQGISFAWNCLDPWRSIVVVITATGATAGLLSVSRADSGPAETDLQEVTVTARRENESVLRVPESITFFDKAAIENLNIQSFPRWPPKIPHLWPLQIPPLDELAMM